jgi:cytochrome b involved in lipid metabolism
MQQKTKIILTIAGAVIVGATLYYVLSTPEQKINDPVMVATTTDSRTENEPLPSVASTTTNLELNSPTSTPVVTSSVVPKTPTPATVPPKAIPPVPAVVVDPAPVKPVTPVGITMATMATHNNESSCWSLIEGKVYDLTTYVPKHPGGKSEILSICGKDGSSLFNGQHGGESKPERILASYYLNVLAQ